MRNKILSALALSLATFSMSAKELVRYTPIDLNPDNYSRSILNFSPIDLSFGKSIGLGFKAEFKTMVGAHIEPYLHYSGTYFTIETSFSSNEPVKPVGEELKPYEFEIGGTYFFVDRNVEADVPVVLSRSSRGRYTVTHITKIPSQVKHMVGVSAGIISSRNIFQLGNEIGSKYSLVSADKNTTVPLSASWFADDESIIYMQNSGAALFTGLKYRNIRRTLINIEGMGKRASTVNLEYYFDLMLQPTINVSDVIVTPTTSIAQHWSVPTGQYSIEGSSAASHLGFRLGGSRQTSNRFGFYQNFELGKAPGYAAAKGFFGSGFYFKLGYGISIGSRKYFMANRDIHQPVDKKKVESTESKSSGTI